MNKQKILSCLDLNQKLKITKLSPQEISQQLIKECKEKLIEYGIKKGEN